MEQFQLNSEQKEGLEKKVEEVAAAADDLNLEKDKEKRTLIKLKNLQTKLEKIKKETDIGELKYDLETRRELAEKIGNVFSVFKFNNGIAAVWTFDEEGKNGFYINKKGEHLFNKRYFNNPNSFIDGLTLVHGLSEGLYLMDTNGENIFPGKYYEVMGNEFNNGALWVKENGKFYFIDRDGNDLSEGKRYDDICRFNQGLAAVKEDDKWYLLNENFERISEGEIFDDINHVITEGHLIVKKNDKYYFLTKKNTSIANSIAYENIRTFSEGLGVVEKDSKWFFVNEDGEEAFPGQYFDDINWDGFTEGLASVKKGGVAFFIDKEGKRAFGDKTFHFALSFSEGLACVGDDDKQSYYINKDGEEVFPGVRFDDEGSFKDGVCHVAKDGEHFQIDIYGKRIFD